MKKKLLSSILAASMIASALTGCGGSKPAEAPAADANTTTETSAATNDAAAGETAEAVDAADAADEGKVLNIYVWNEEFKLRV